ncbi:hypothetical protein JCGZ_01908 [Jatropha curcas]|uniref:Disease resistance N-terminal domain-containing protein n=1 Tax=Jatropha curcas TaxID=180498 RepID=A0A067LCA3_JATCU|nr:hypothetical protein JCGZ_01908 [Jatropha curcas]
MAEFFAFAIAERVLEKLASNTYKEIRLAWDYEGEVKKLEEILSTIKAVLLDAEEKQKQATKNELRVWLARLKGALYDDENVLDEYEYEFTRRRVLQLYGTAIKRLGTGVLKGTVRGVLGSGSLEVSGSGVCYIARSGAFAPLEVQGMCSTGVLQRHGSGLHLQCGHGRGAQHGLGRARLWKSRANVARACGSAWAGVCAPDSLLVLPCS